MGGIFGVVSKKDCVADLFFGTDYHSHLGTRRGGMAVYDQEEGFDRAIHNIENSPFRTKFERDVQEMKGQIGIGCINDSDPQPLIVRAHYGNFVLTTVCRINNADDIVERVLSKHRAHFMEMSSGKVNATELVASIIAARDNLLDGIKAAQEMVDGSLTMLIMTKDGIYASRDRLGRTPLIIGKKEDGYCASFESFAYQNLGYSDAYELGPNEIVYITADGYETVSPAGKEMKICAFLWTYYGYPTSTYEGVNVEAMRYRCGEALAKRDTDVPVDSVAGVPDSGIAHAIGYANESGIPFSRPLIKYTPTWPRSFMPPTQSMRHLIAKMKLISVDALIRDKKLLFIDDSIVRGTQMSDTASHLFSNGAREVHVRSACPPIMYGCKYLNFSRSTSEYDLITRRIIREREGDNDENVVADYADQNSRNHKEMVDTICKRLKFTSLKYHELEDMIESIGIDPCKVCTYCWNGKE
ncbi:amidophosphoribosyltransferase [Eubacterium limosum]|uniref:amidophosphoribosyltransferase n=1 Tax=Eubacterium limosum TaxID=1736 RepID=UPI000D718A5D|nr:amidophosphoribosyltransferase [Eubacterium limosum]PWW56414.1 amidophosphoribosyltransferase [Eubacterium limosum]